MCLFFKFVCFVFLMSKFKSSPGGSDNKASARSAGDRLIPGLGKSPGEGNGNSLQYSCLENPTDGGAWWATVRGVAKSDTTEQLHFYFLQRTCYNSL